MAIIQPKSQSTSSGFGGFNGFGSTGITQTDILLAQAIQQGGAVEQIANELTGHNRGILSTISDTLKNSFSSFVDLISKPSEAVAGLLSPDYTVQEAIKNKIRPSDVILGESSDPNATAMQKVGNFFVRTAIDVMTDPLTYVTFGTNASLFGAKALTKVTLSSGEVATLSRRGNDLLNEFFAAKQAGVESTLVKNRAVELVNQAQKVGQDLNIQDALLQVKRSQAEMSDIIAKVALDAPLNREYATETMGRLLGNKPALLETFADKGGIKFFGQTLLSGQRIKSTLAVLPGMTMVDRATEGLRNSLGALFNPNYTTEGRVPQETVDKIQKWKDLAESQKNQALSEIPRIWKALGITAHEDTLIRAAVEADKIPADPKLAEIWKAAKGYQSQLDKTDPRLIAAIRQVQSITRRNLQQAWDAGIKVTEIPNYVPHFLVKEDIKKLPSKLAPATTLRSSLESKIAKFRDVKNPEKELVGNAELLGLKPHIREREIKKIQDNLDAHLTRLNIEHTKLNSDINNLMDRVATFFKGKSTAVLETLAQNAGIKDQVTIRSFMGALEDLHVNLDINQMTKDYIAANYKEGVKLKAALGDLSEEAINTLLQQMKEGKATFISDVATFNDAIKAFQFSKKASKVRKTGIDPAGELRQFAEKIKKDALLTRKSVAERALDKKSTAEVLQVIAEQQARNPSGVRRILDAIVGRKQALTDIAHEIQFEKLSAKTQIADLPNAFRYFEDKNGNTYERVRATVEDAASAGIHFEQGALVPLVRSSLDTIKVTTMKHLVDDIAKEGVVASKAPQGFRPVSVKGLKGDKVNLAQFVTSATGEELYYHPQTAKLIENFIGTVINDEPTQQLMRSFDKIQNLWKASVTSVWPAFHGRNALSNVFLHFLDIGLHSLNPTNHIWAANMIANNYKFERLLADSIKPGQKGRVAKEQLDALSDKVVLTDNAGTDWRFGEMRKMIQDHVVAFNPNLLGQIDVTKTQKDMVQELSNSLFAKDTSKFNPFKWGRSVGNAIEGQARLVDFLVNFRNTGNVNFAAARTKQFLFDYQNLTPFEKTFMRRIIPFYTFSRKNLELQVHSLLTTPGRISNQITAVTTLGEVLAGGQLTPDQQAALPDWLQGGLNILKSKKGSTIEIYQSLGTPIEQPFQQLAPNVLLGSISPIVRLPVELGSGYSFFNAKPLSEVTNAAAFKNAPAFIKDFIGFSDASYTLKDGTKITHYVALRPTRMYMILNLPPTSRVLTSLKQMNAVDVSQQSRILQQLIGLRPFTFNLELEAAKREKETQKKLEDLLSNAGVGYTFSRFVLPKKTF